MPLCLHKQDKTNARTNEAMESYFVDNIEAIFEYEGDHDEAIVLMIQGELYVRAIGDIYSGFHQLSTLQHGSYVHHVTLTLDGAQFYLYAHKSCRDFHLRSLPRKEITLGELEEFMSK